ncbi:DUF6904 family protein [Flavobacterium lindanitolerans]|uniref:DUF6904 family protein n=1 Tax=Flavobacterium lindanitolerans TaxID=428988 RepID=UPI0023F58697|nr:hypothetical protein [Flavobacterium lindanitolerans]
MLQAFPTKNGTGLSIFGDYYDLSSLYETIHHIADVVGGSDERTSSQSKLLMNFAYEVRKACSGQRLIEQFRDGSADSGATYFGFQCVWTDILVFISTIRHNAGYSRTEKIHQANLYILESVVERALFAYDAEGADTIKNFIGQGINITDPYSFLLYQTLHIRFVLESPGKRRFRNIPKLIMEHFSGYGNHYKDLVFSFEVAAKERGCPITELELSEFPEIKW